jgi:hypothetical protein
MLKMNAPSTIVTQTTAARKKKLREQTFSEQELESISLEVVQHIKQEIREREMDPNLQVAHRVPMLDHELEDWLNQLKITLGRSNQNQIELTLESGDIGSLRKEHVFEGLWRPFHNIGVDEQIDIGRSVAKALGLRKSTFRLKFDDKGDPVIRYLDDNDQRVPCQFSFVASSMYDMLKTINKEFLGSDNKLDINALVGKGKQG